MKKPFFSQIAGWFAVAIGVMSAQLEVAAQVTIQDPSNVVGTGATAWSYLILEGEDYDEKTNEAPEVGFTRVDASGAITSFLGNPILGPNTTASKKGALWTQTIFQRHADQVTYQVQFAKAGTYYLYMRFSMFENGGNVASYGNEDSFFVPPAFDADPLTDWPVSDDGGYTEGCCAEAGYLYIKENGEKVNHSIGEEEGQAFWEGLFHWNELSSSQWINPDTQGAPNVRHKYEVTEAQVGKPLNWTISYREGGTAVDLWLFSTNPNLMDEYTQAQLDQLLIPVETQVTVQDPSNVVGTGATAWSYLILEGEDYDEKTNEAPEVGFTRVDASGAITSFLGNPILGPNTTASKKGALWTQTIFQRHADQVTYQVQFAKAGTYYLYMRFSMFENGGNVASYGNEDSFFVPPAFDADPLTDWPVSDDGGYTEGCCAEAGYLYIKENGEKVNHSIGEEEGQAFWEGLFHWNELSSSQWINPDTQGAPNVRHKYEVTEAQVGKPLNWTISYREGGTAVDLWLFSTNPNLMDEYTQAQLDQVLINPVPSLTVSHTGNSAVVSWPVSATGFALESSTALAPAIWTLVPDAPVVVGDQNTVTVDATNGTKYYRLRKP